MPRVLSRSQEMYGKILIYVDGSFAHEVAARYGLAMAKAFEAESIIAGSYESEDERSRVDSSIQRIVMVAESMGLAPEKHLKQGRPLQSVRRAVVDLGVDAVVGSLGAGEVSQRGLRTDSTVVRLLRGLECTVVLARVVNCGTPLSHQSVLAPVQPSHGQAPSVSELVNLVSGLTMFYDARLTLMSCVEIRRRMLYEWEALDKLKIARRMQLKSVVEAFMKSGLRPTLRIRACVLPDKEILDLVSRERHDLVIARAPRKTSLSPLRGPGVIERVLLGTPSNVLIWKPGRGR